MNLIEINIMKLHTETKKLFEDLIHSKVTFYSFIYLLKFLKFQSEHTTIEKTAANLNK